jgi:desulfoferrodoxin-like iron-binding protein
MKRQWVFIIAAALLASCVVLTHAASGKSAGPALQASAAGTSQDYVQDKPYTKADPGPWPAAVADKHSPEIIIENTELGLKVTVKVDHHPMDATKPHYIMWIRLEDGEGKKLGEKTFQMTDPAPEAWFSVTSTPAKLRAFERCNIHGIWMSETKVEAQPASK